MKYQYIARELYKRTFFKSYVSANELRRFNLHKALDTPNSSGPFFNNLGNEGYLEKIGRVKATHDEARGRFVNCWRWTRKAFIKFGRDLR